MWTIEAVNRGAEREFESLPQDMRAGALKILGMLTTEGPDRIHMPYVRPLANKIWEIRVNGASGIGRVIYTLRSGRRLVILHTFIKKTRKTPAGAIQLALDRLREWP